MKKMILASLITNVAVLIPVCGGLLLDASWVADVYWFPQRRERHPPVSVRRTTRCLDGPTVQAGADARRTVAAVSRVYRLTTPFIVGSFTNPVVISNIVSSAMHLTTLGLIDREVRCEPLEG